MLSYCAKSQECISRAAKPSRRPLIRLFGGLQLLLRHRDSLEALRHDVLALGKDPIAECTRRRSVLGPHLEADARPLRHVKPVMIVVLGDEDVIDIGVHDSRESRIKLNDSPTSYQLAKSEVLEPAFRALHAVELA